jgi:hypothetical protein
MEGPPWAVGICVSRQDWKSAALRKVNRRGYAQAQEGQIHRARLPLKLQDWGPNPVLTIPSPSSASPTRSANDVTREYFRSTVVERRRVVMQA